MKRWAQCAFLPVNVQREGAPSSSMARNKTPRLAKKGCTVGVVPCLNVVRIHLSDIDVNAMVPEVFHEAFSFVPVITTMVRRLPSHGSRFFVRCVVVAAGEEVLPRHAGGSNRRTPGAAFIVGGGIGGGLFRFGRSTGDSTTTIAIVGGAGAESPPLAADPPIVFECRLERQDPRHGVVVQPRRPAHDQDVPRSQQDGTNRMDLSSAFGSACYCCFCRW
mmetsp:Transcript_17983/g.36886  ORF Transcript_17983/g.36886 Transcript_17983/m.36886 type:complete len:219 (-) Transcript_17983:142-798(-)